MTCLKLSFFALLATLFIQATRPSPDPAVFVASSPCDGIPRSMLSIPATTNCELIKWTLALRRDPRNQAPYGFTLNYTYGLSKPSTTDFINGGTQGVLEGKWTMVTEASNRVIYRLTPATSGPALNFVRLDEGLLHLLDQQGKLMIGHGGWSYTLNRK